MDAGLSKFLVTEQGENNFSRWHWKVSLLPRGNTDSFYLLKSVHTLLKTVSLKAVFPSLAAAGSAVVGNIVCRHGGLYVAAPPRGKYHHGGFPSKPSGFPCKVPRGLRGVLTKLPLPGGNVCSSGAPPQPAPRGAKSPSAGGGPPPVSSVWSADVWAAPAWPASPGTPAVSSPSSQDKQGLVCARLGLLLL